MVSLLFCRFDVSEFNSCKDIKLHTTEVISTLNPKNSIIDPQVSIIIPCYNACEQLKACILSIQNQLFTDYEVHIIDGKSTDGTLQFLQTLQAPFYVLSETDQGVYDAMNKGLAKAKGSWVYFMGSDDQFFESNVLASIFKRKIEPEIDLIIGNIKYDDVSTAARHLNKDDEIRKSNWSSRLWLTNSVHHQGVFYRHSVFEARRYNLSYNILSDYDLNLELFKQGKTTKMIKTVVAFCGANGLSKTYNWRMYKEEIRLKTSQSSVLLKPAFFVLAFLKYTLKQVQD